jgi:hypothetical protein
MKGLNKVAALLLLIQQAYGHVTPAQGAIVPEASTPADSNKVC